MKKIVLILVSLLCLYSCTKKTADSNINRKQLRHVVLFKFKNEAPPEAIKEIEDSFIGLPSKIKTIKSFEWGLNNSTEGLDKGLSHCFFVTFDSEKDRDEYLPHPAHLEFVAVLKPHLEDAVVVDYWAN